ncbi:MAG: hypothetical protein NT062_00545 [Proteobacteria bacterium]|nr:hypothetical protein [Pseudomonadota bacterium]
MAGIAVAGCSSDKKTTKLIDAPVSDVDAPDVVAACNVLTQTGCNAGEKCTWFEDDMSSPPIGHIGCAPVGTVAIGGACTTGAPGATGYDNCVGGSVCVGATCEAICDNAGGAPMCGTGFGCVNISGLFGAAGAMTPPAAGVCETACNPINDNDYDGSGAAQTRTGSACGSDPLMGCYGNISSSGNRTHFICAYPALSGPTHTAGTATILHRQMIPAGQLYLNTCHPGYTLGFAANATGSTESDCYAFCKPGNSFGSLGTATGVTVPATQLPNGQTGAACKLASGGRGGSFGIVPTGVTTPAWTTTDPGAIGNGEHCMYSWYFETNDAGDVLLSDTSNDVGICWDHSQYNGNFDQNAATANQQLPPCSRLELSNPDPNTFTADFLGCVDTTTAKATTAANGKLHMPNWEKAKRLRPNLVIPAFDPRFAGALSLEKPLH